MSAARLPILFLAFSLCSLTVYAEDPPSEPAATATTSASAPGWISSSSGYDETVADEYHKESTCRKANQQASECCQHPERCLIGVDGDPDSDNMAGQAIGMLFGAALQMPTSEISQMCNRMGTMGKAMSAMNGYLAVRCGAYIAKCRSACDQDLVDVKNELGGEETDTYCDDKNNREQPACKYYRKRKSLVKRVSEECQDMTANAMQMGQQVIAAQMSVKYADMCRDQVASSTADFSQDPFTADCSGANASTPLCQNGCNRPEMASTPTCQAILAERSRLAGGGMGMGDLGGAGRDPSDLFDGAPGDDEGLQNPLLNDTEAKNSTARVGGGGGGGGLGGGGDSGGSGGTMGGGAGDAGGYDTAIMKGTSSGGGYSGGGGGYRSPASQGGYVPQSSRSVLDRGFNLSKYLPGGKKVASLSPGRSVATADSDVSSIHGNIFQNITNRFYQVCLRDALYDCATLKKLKGR